jgi:kynurenine formamidase
VDGVLRTDRDIERALPELSNWGRWGTDEEVGTLNFITPQTRAAAAALVTSGETVSMARPISLVDGSVERGAHEVTRRPGGGSRDFIGLVFHGFAVTHLDALCHASDGRELYNGYADQLRDGTYENADVAPMGAAGIVGRGVLIDIAALRGSSLTPGDAIAPEELDTALDREGVATESGDIIWIRTGLGRMNQREGRAGLDADCLPWLRDREAALLGSDGDSDAAPTSLDEWGSPMHSVGIWKMGLPLVDNAELEPLAQTCERLRRWTFLCMVVPLPLRGATGSPVNPMALF